MVSLSGMPGPRLLLLALVTLLGGCHCQQSEAERLRSRVDSLRVHVYLAAKIAVVEDDDPDTKAAHDAVMAGVASLKGDGDGMSAADATNLVKAVFGLRERGKALAQTQDDSKMSPVLPRLTNQAALKDIDLPTEHALLLTGMVLLASQPAAPVPVPKEVMLYEAWMTDPAALSPGLRDGAHLGRAIAFGDNGLCDMAAAETAKVDLDEEDAKAMSTFLESLTGKAGSVGAAESKRMTAGLHSLAHVTLGKCFLRRGKVEPGLAAFDQALTSAGDAGLSDDQLAAARAQIAKLRDDPKAFDDSFLRGPLEEKVLRHLESAPSLEQLQKSEAVTAVAHFLGATSRAIDRGRDALPDADWLDEAKSRLDR